MEFPHFPEHDDGTLATAHARIDALAALLRAATGEA